MSSRVGKVLRYVVSRRKNGHQDPTTPQMCMNKIQWSDLPHTILQAKATLEKLRALGYVERVGNGYIPTDEGEAVLALADKQKLWRR